MNTNIAKSYTPYRSGERITISAGIIEFNSGGNTVWIQSTEGSTTLRIKCSGKINVERCKDSPVSHCDIYIQGDINFCISKDAQ
jgi:hypothetical protein